MATSQSDAQYVIERMQSTSLPGAYVLGCGARRVTVLSQQYRAFNLVWALFEEGRLKEGDRLGVVGGGIGGLTVAAAAMLRGCDVVLVEERPDLMHLQRLNYTRLLHPHINEWPDPMAEESRTRLPCMNWSADLAGRVVEVIDREWARLVSTFGPVVRRDTQVTSVDRRGPDGKLVIVSSEWESNPCDAIVLAVGFGVESSTPGVQSATYWENDKLAQSVRGPLRVKRCFVSGLGDGGCIDVLRLCYSSFDHGQFVRQLIRLSELSVMREKLLEIDLRMPDVDQSRYLREEYAKLPFPSDFASHLGTPRRDTLVELNGSEAFPYSPKACILHRVALWGLDMANRFTYRPGPLDVTQIETRPAPSGIRYMVPVPGGGGFTAFDELILRHGPTSVVQSFPNVTEGYEGIKGNPAQDRTRRQIYPSDFYSPLEPTVIGTPQEEPSILNGPSGETGAAGAPAPPMMIESNIESATGLLTFQPARTTLPSENRIETLTIELMDHTSARNIRNAREIASQLEPLLRGPVTQQSLELWERAYKSLCDLEILEINQARSSGELRDTARLYDLIERMQHDIR